MTKHREWFYSEDDTEQVIDGYPTEHCLFDIIDAQNEDGTLDTTDLYFFFGNAQSGKLGSGVSIPTVEYWEYAFFGTWMTRSHYPGASDSYYSFPIAYNFEDFGYFGSSGTYTIQLAINAGGST